MRQNQQQPPQIPIVETLEQAEKLLLENRDKIAASLEEGDNANGFIYQVLNDMEKKERKKDENLLKCTENSFLGAVLKGASSGLELGEEAYLVNYFSAEIKKKEMAWQLGYKGALALAWQTEKYKVIDADVIREKDARPLARKGSDYAFEFAPDHFKERGKIAGFYCYVELISGGRDHKIMTRAEMDAHRDQYAGKNPVWNYNYPAMGKKTVFTQLLKFKPLDRRLRAALAHADRVVNYDAEKDALVYAAWKENAGEQPPRPKTSLEDMRRAAGRPTANAAKTPGKPDERPRDPVKALADMVDRPENHGAIQRILRDEKAPRPSKQFNAFRTGDPKIAATVCDLIKFHNSDMESYLKHPGLNGANFHS